MLIKILTILNFLFFFLGLAFFYFAKKNRERPVSHPDSHADQPDEQYEVSDPGGSGNPGKDQEKILEIYQKVAVKIEQIRRRHISSGIKIQGATEDSIQQFSNLIERLKKTTGKTREILDLMGVKIALSLVKDTVGKKHGQVSEEETRKKYEQILKDVMDQLSLITAQKLEDVSKLDKIKNKMVSATPYLKEITSATASIKNLATDAKALGPENENAREISIIADKILALVKNSDESVKKIRDEINLSSESIEKSVIVSIKEAIEIESSFIHSTMLLLQDLVLSLVESFIQLNSLMDSTLGESSSVGDEINAIVVNLQCEDICNELSEYTLEFLSSLTRDLHELELAGLTEDDFIRIDEQEKSQAEEEEESGEEEEVTFF